MNLLEVKNNEKPIRLDKGKTQRNGFSDGPKPPKSKIIPKGQSIKKESMNPIYAIYDKNKEFIAAFPSYEEAANYGYDNLGDGWRYNISEKYMLDYPIIKGLDVPKYHPTIRQQIGYQPKPSGYYSLPPPRNP